MWGSTDSESCPQPLGQPPKIQDGRVGDPAAEVEETIFSMTHLG